MAAGPETVAREAVEHLELPEPAIRMYPDPNADDLLFVNSRAWFWLDPATWVERTSVASVPGVSVTVRARPVRTVWDMGDWRTPPGRHALDGDRYRGDGSSIDLGPPPHWFVCEGPGTPFNPNVPRGPGVEGEMALWLDQDHSCSYVYAWPSVDEPGLAYTVTATAEWEVTWSASGAPGGGRLEPITRSSSILLPVGVSQAVNIE